MKLAPILLFFSYWSNAIASDNLKVCQDQSFTTDGDKNLRTQYQNEYSLVVSVKKTWSKVFKKKEARPLPPPKIEGKLAKFLCACVFYKIQNTFEKNPDTGEEPAELPFDEIFQHTSSGESKLGIYIWPYYFVVPFYEHHFPAVYCSLGERAKHRYLLAKGPDKEDGKQLYNVYVAKVTGWDDGEPLYQMRGFMPEVNLGSLERQML